MPKAISKAFRTQISQEYKALRQDENVLHNADLHRRILTSWRQDSPEMWQRLQRAELGQKLAYVLQERMWRERDALVKAGMAVTDAREQAERNNLMLEPESILRDRLDSQKRQLRPSRIPPL